jgi:hypothetical protein
VPLGSGWTPPHPNRLVRDGAAPDDLDLVLALPWL